MNGGNPWTEVEVERLRALTQEGRLTYRGIAVELGRSKDSVIGKVHRLKLPVPPPDPVAAVRGAGGRWVPRQVAAPPQAAPEPPRAPLVVAALNGHAPAWLFNRVFPPVHDCQWPVSPDRPWRFCEAPTVPHRSYCLEHCRRGYHVIARHSAFRPGAPRYE